MCVTKDILFGLKIIIISDDVYISHITNNQFIRKGSFLPNSCYLSTFVGKMRIRFSGEYAGQKRWIA